MAFLRVVSFYPSQNIGGTRVLVSIGLLWYCYAIVTGEVRGQDRAVWARFVLVTSLLLFVRFSTLLTRHCR